MQKLKMQSSGLWNSAAAAVALSCLAVPILAQAQVPEPDAFTQAAMERRRDAQASLASAMARIGTDRTDANALVDAARASLTLDNPQAALGFLTRAGQLRTDDGVIAAMTGSAMLQLERPEEAMEHFERAARQGAPDRLYLSDRALAFDLLGKQDLAQRDYEAALSQTNDPETTRRFALSLGISGQVDRAVAVLTPQLRSQDRAAWRTRAMIYAIVGRQSEAQEIVKATMPGPLVASITPFLARMPSLTPGQQAAAAHFGALPGGTKPGLPPPPPPVKPKPAVIAAVPPTPKPMIVATVPPPKPIAPPSTPPAAKPILPPNDLASVAAAIEIPASELAQTDGALDVAALERLKEEQRRAALEASEARKRDVAAARLKAAADATAKEEADRKKANPARIWVQVATGANASALANDLARMARKFPAEFKGQKGATSEWGRTRRLLVGPFASTKAANSWLASLKKAGGDGFTWSSDPGQEIVPVR